MLAFYVVLLTIGVVLSVPAVLRAIDRIASNTIADAAGVGAFVGGVVGLLARQVGANGTVTFIVAAAVGLAAGVMSPEVLARLRDLDRAEAVEPVD